MGSSFIGKVIDNYRIIQHLGIGGMGVVFKAVHINLDKVVALKMIAPGLAMNQRFIQRFETEAKALAKMEDANIVNIYDLRHENDQWFIVMEYIEGITLTEKIKNDGALPWRKGTPILQQILTSIGHAHQAGIIHRDIKPNNIMLANNGQIKITDFGLAKDQQGNAHTMTITSGGTLYYMSPEHVKGFAFTDHRSDIYSIGMTAYEMLTGKVPFSRAETDFDIREKIMRKGFPSLRKWEPDIPRELDKIIMKSIAKQPEKRYQSAEEMLTELNAFYSPQPAEDDMLPRMTRPKRMNYPMAATILVLLIIISIFLYKISYSTKTESSIDAVVPQDSTTVTTENKSIPEKEPAAIENTVKQESPEVGKKDNTAQVQKSMSPPEITLSEYKEAAATTAPISIQSEPEGATIWADGRIIGRTPFSLSRMETGRREFVLKKEGFQDLNQIFDIQGDKNNSFTVILTPVMGTATIISKPEGATIFLDGKELESKKTPVQLEEIAVGNHMLVAKKIGFADLQTDIEINKDEKNIIQLELIQLFGNLQVWVKPWGSIFIDGELKKENTKIKYNVDLPVSSYNIRIVHPTLGRYEKNVSLTPDQILDLRVDFNQIYQIKISAVDTNGTEIESQLYLDGVIFEQKTPTVINLRTGIHILELKQGIYDKSQTVLVDEATPKTMKFILE
jgi:serine/threonine protein kinase